MNITIDTATLSNEVLARLAAVIGDAAIEAYEQAQRTGFRHCAEDYAHNAANARALVRLLIARAGDDEAQDMADAYGIDPDMFASQPIPLCSMISDKPATLEQIADAARALGLTAEITVN